MSTEAFGLYIHIPYCRHICPYCDFNTKATKASEFSELSQALQADIQFNSDHKDWSGRELRTIYFGGGTPSLLGAESLSQIITSAKQSWNLQDDAEVCLEANPEDLSENYLEGLKKAGFNRLSIGVQSFDPKVLRFLGRKATTEQMRTALSNARAANFQSLSMDLMFAIPNMSEDSLALSLSEILEFNPEHVSTYSLTLEQGTPLHAHHAKGGFSMPASEQAVAQDKLIEERLLEQGIHRYEISNFSKPGYESKHNSAYWEGRDYLGIGPGAHSFLRGESKRSERVRDTASYLKRAPAEREAWSESLSEDDLKLEYIYLSLRQVKGLSFSDYKARFTSNFKEEYAPTLAQSELLQYFKLSETSLKLNPEGLLLLDQIASEFAHS